jgi:FKBP-type peptidyl-prolyl cis-trans isomerase FkpA
LTPFFLALQLLATQDPSQNAQHVLRTDDVASVDLSTDDAKTDYALGFTVGSNIARGKPFAPDRAAAISNGLDDALSGKSAQVDMPTYGPKVQQMMSARTPPPPGLAEEKKKGTDFADTAAQQLGAEKLASGLVFKSIKAGSGANPTAADVVQVNYEGKLTDGTVFDASAKHGGPATFPLNHVIPCWTEGLQKLKMGGKAELVCPSSIAYGDMGHPPTIPGGATLVFTVELLGINRAGAQPGAAKATAKEEKAEKRRDASLLVCNAHYWRRKIQQEYANAKYGGVIDMEEVYFDEQQAAAEEPDENLAEAKKWLRENHVKPLPCRSFTLYDDGRYQDDAATDGDMTNKADAP